MALWDLSSSPGDRQPLLGAVEGLDLAFLHSWTRCRAGQQAPSIRTNQERAENHGALFGDGWRMDLPARFPIDTPCGEV